MPTGREVVGKGWEAYAARDLDGVVALMAPSVGFERYEVGVYEIVEVSPGLVLTESWQSAYVAGSQNPVQMELAQISMVEAGLVARLELWSDRAAARAEAYRRSSRALP